MSRHAWLAAALVCVGACGSEPATVKKAYVYEIPKDFKGWVRVDFEQPTCPALRQTPDGQWIVEVDNRGRVCTSTSIQHASWADSDFVRVGAAPRPMVEREGDPAREIWREGGGTEECPQGKRPFEALFVGTKEERAKAPDPPSCPEL